MRWGCANRAVGCRGGFEAMYQRDDALRDLDGMVADDQSLSTRTREVRRLTIRYAASV